MQKTNDERNLAEIYSRAARVPRRKIDEALEKNTILEVIQNHYLITDATPTERRRMEDLTSFCSLYESATKMAQASYQIGGPADAFNYLAPEMRGLSCERVDMLLLNTRHRVIKRETLSIGSLAGAGVTPQKVIRTAVIYNAAGVVIAHNHPSGDSKPSPDDINTTKAIAKALDLVGIDLVDHLVIGNNNYASMKELGICEEKSGYFTQNTRVNEEQLPYGVQSEEEIKKALEGLGDLLYLQKANGEVIWPIEALHAFNEKELAICKTILFPDTLQPSQNKGGKSR